MAYSNGWSCFLLQLQRFGPLLCFAANSENVSFVQTLTKHPSRITYHEKTNILSQKIGSTVRPLALTPTTISKGFEALLARSRSV
ncbi:hypothetical protein DFH07DRAFT_210666 [Mycena maculata]|uniref:Secreted protein n=1 Tax=Mycena maculata TaxID=230809 RepID=A0AAD7P1S3_9AGAR|nr:hypothetical protein DFH07DRAFT_210666 [Mycena maculata]